MPRMKFASPITKKQTAAVDAAFQKVGKSLASAQSAMIKSGFTKFQADNLLANMAMTLSWQALSVSCREQERREPKSSRFVACAREVSGKPYTPVYRVKVTLRRDGNEWAVIDDKPAPA